MKAYIETRYKKEKAYIYISITHGINAKGNPNKTLLKTGVAVNKVYWEEKRIVDHTRRIALNNDIGNRLEFVENYIFSKRNDRNITTEKVKQHYMDHFYPKKTQSKYFLECVCNLIEERLISNKFANSTNQKHVQRFKIVKEVFSKYNMNPTLDEMNIKHWDAIESHCTNSLRNENVTVNNFIKIFKCWMNKFIDYGYTANNFHRGIKKLNDGEKDFEFLNEEELRKINNLDLENQTLINVRAFLLIQSNIGLREGDLMKLDRVNYYTDETGEELEYQVKFVTGKNKKLVKLKIPEYVYEIAKRYNFQLPKISNTTYNKGIKTLCKLAEINYAVQTVKYIGSEIIRETKYKWEVITSHSLRRSFVTNGIIRGISRETMMIIIGSSDMETFERYICLKNIDAYNEYNSKTNF